MSLIRHLVDGRESGGATRTGSVFDPATGAVQRTVAFASTSEVEEAIAAASAALPAWRETGLVKRADVFFRLRQLLVERQDELAAIITSEHGKVLSDAKGEISRGIENVEFAAGLVHLLKGERSEQVARGVDVHSVKQPVGVVAAITPFNFPIMVPLWMTASAIACGNTVVLKPSEKDPSASVFLAKLFEEAGLPAGVLNVVHGDKEAVDAIIDSPDVRAVSFVGSTPVARCDLRARHRARQARAGARRREEPHGRDGGCRSRRRRRRRRVRRLRVGGRALHGDLGARRGRRPGRRRAHREGVRARRGTARSDRHGSRVGDGPAHHARAPRQGRLVRHAAPRPRARPSSSTARPWSSTPTGSSSASRSSTTSSRA